MQQTYEDIASEVNELLHKMDPMGPTSPVPTEFLAGGSQATLQLKELKGQPPCCTRLLSRWPCCVILLIFGLFAAAATVVATRVDEVMSLHETLFIVSAAAASVVESRRFERAGRATSALQPLRRRPLLLRASCAPLSDYPIL